MEIKKKKQPLETTKLSYKVTQRAEETTSHLQSFYAMNHPGKQCNNDDIEEEDDTNNNQ